MNNKAKVITTMILISLIASSSGTVRASAAQSYGRSAIINEIEYHNGKFRSNKTIYIDHGLFFNSRKGTDSGDIVVYDRKNKRLYFHAALR